MFFKLQMSHETTTNTRTLLTTTMLQYKGSDPQIMSSQITHFECSQHSPYRSKVKSTNAEETKRAYVITSIYCAGSHTLTPSNFPSFCVHFLCCLKLHSGTTSFRISSNILLNYYLGLKFLIPSGQVWACSQNPHIPA